MAPDVMVVDEETKATCWKNLRYFSPVPTLLTSGEKKK